MNLKQGTTVIMVGPLVSTDGVAVSSDATLDTDSVLISKNGAAFVAKTATEASVYDSTADIGWYRVFLDTGETGSTGVLIISAQTTHTLPAWHTFNVVPVFNNISSTDVDDAVSGLSTVSTGDLDAVVVGLSTVSTGDLDAVVVGLSTHTATDVKTQAVAALSTVGFSTEATANALTTADVDAVFVDYGPSTFSTSDYDNLTSQVNYNSISKGSSFEFDIVMVQSTDHRSPSSGDTVTGYYSNDGSTFVALTTDSAITDIGNGAYHVALSTAETNANFSASYRFVATGADARIVTLRISK